MWDVSLPHASPGSTESISPLRPAAGARDVCMCGGGRGERRWVMEGGSAAGPCRGVGLGVLGWLKAWAWRVDSCGGAAAARQPR